MIITFITVNTPSLKRGAPVRSYNLIKEAVRQGAIVDLITLIDKEDDTPNLKNELGVRKVFSIPLKKAFFLSYVWGIFFHRIPPYFVDYRLSDMSSAVISYAKTEKPDMIQLELLHSYDAISSVIPNLKALGIKIILNAHNAEYNIFKESISTFSWIRYIIGVYIASHLLSIEQKATQAVDHIFTCSESDRSFFIKAASEKKVTVIPNGVDCSMFKAEPLIQGRSLIFMGGMNYPPNDDALHFYFHNIHQLVKKEIPDVKITLLGGEPSPWLKKNMQTDSSIIAPGLVPDVREYIRDSRVCISPIRKGSGTSLKILEYMGSGKPIVSTRIGVRGILCEDEKDLLIADNAKDFAHAIVRLLRDNELATRLGADARNKVERYYDWKIIGKKMMETYRAIL